MDNIDHNTSARSSKDSFHGTAISLTQHPTMYVHGEEKGLTATYDNTTSATNIRPLSATYSEVPQVGLDVTEYSVSQLHGEVSPGSDSVIAALDYEKKWPDIYIYADTQFNANHCHINSILYCGNVFFK